MSGEYWQHQPAGANDRLGIPAPTRRIPGHPAATRSNPPSSNRVPTGANGQFIFQMKVLKLVVGLFANFSTKAQIAEHLLGQSGNCDVLDIYIEIDGHFVST